MMANQKKKGNKNALSVKLLSSLYLLPQIGRSVSKLRNMLMLVDQIVVKVAKINK